MSFSIPLRKNNPTRNSQLLMIRVAKLEHDARNMTNMLSDLSQQFTETLRKEMREQMEVFVIVSLRKSLRKEMFEALQEKQRQYQIPHRRTLRY